MSKRLASDAPPRKRSRASIYQTSARVFRAPKAVNNAVRAQSRVLTVEGKTFDPVAVTTTLQMFLDTSTAVADSANGYIKQGSAANASAIVINQVPIGTTSTTRIGRRVNMKSLRVTGAFLAPTGIQFGLSAKLALVYIPTLDRGTTVMPPYNVIWGFQDPVAQRVIDNSDRFRVLKNWTCNIIGDRDAATTGKEALYFDEMINLKGLITEWKQTNTDGSFNDMERGALCLYGCGSGGAGATTSILLNFTCRLYYEDM